MSETAPSRTEPGDTAALRAADGAPTPRTPSLLITAGPTREPLDAVRYLGNRSSGRLGIELASAAARRGWATTLLLGPTSLGCNDTRVETIRFSSTAELGALLDRHTPRCDCLLMAAAVADFRPSQDASAPQTTKLRRRDGGLTLHLEATPDLLAQAARGRRPGQLLVGFALEPRERLIDAAKAKLTRKGVDLIVANPLETMDSDQIEARLIEKTSDPTKEPRIAGSTEGAISKQDFAIWLLDHLEQRIPCCR